MRRTAIAALALPALVLFVACGSGAASSAPASVPASAPASSSAATSVCAVAGPDQAPVVVVSIKGSNFATEPVKAAVGEVIGWTNEDTLPHTATLDDGSCDTGTIAGGATGALVFNEAGTYPYKCKIHSSMKGTIEISG